MTLKHFYALFVMPLWLLFSPSGLEASWFIDAARYHFSVHGNLVCVDCHETQGDETLHPNPLNVTGRPEESFKPGRCTSCHDDLEAVTRAGMHGGVPVGGLGDIADCRPCHDPHYEFRPDESTSDFDPSKSVYGQCGVCHERKPALPEPEAGTRACASCHLLSAEQDAPESVRRVLNLCFTCHGLRDKGTPAETPARLIRAADYALSPHAPLACITCHPEAGRYAHAGQETIACRQCHPPHDEKVAHDAHLTVSCEACHRKGAAAVQDMSSRRILPGMDPGAGPVTRAHDMAIKKDEIFCTRCHFTGNRLGAVSMVLPPKGLICVPCHAATLSAGDAVTLLSLVIFLIGMLGTASVWVSGSLSGEKDMHAAVKILQAGQEAVRTVFSLRLFRIVRVLLLDALLQRRLFARSRTRWLIHGMIFYPLMFRLFWGLCAMISSVWVKDWPGAWLMLDKNFPAGAFLFDLSGILVLTGMIFALGRGIRGRRGRPPGLPGQDWPALALMMGMILIGFLLEGMRMVMTGNPPAGNYAFIGFILGLLLSGISGLNDIYGYVWYIHAVLAGAFVAYLPFSRMLHLLTAPVSLAWKAASLPPGKTGAGT